MNTRFSTMVGVAAGLLMGVTATVQAQFRYTTSGGTVTITGYTGPGGDVVIPDTIDEKPVTTVGDRAFSGCTGLTSVTIGNSVTRIADFAFSGCTSLTAIEVASLNPAYSSLDGVLFNKTQTTLIECPEGKAGAYTIPDSVTEIGSWAFLGCTSLTAIEADPLNPAYTSLDGVLFNKSQTILIQCPGAKGGAYTIPDSVTSIGVAAFYDCTSLTSVVIPDSVTEIGGSAFYGCTSLSSVTIGNSVTSIGGGTFGGCTGLTAIEVASLNPAYSSLDGVLFNKTQTTLIECPEGKTGAYTIPDNVTSITNDAFSDCRALTAIVISDSVTRIEVHAFSDCTSLTSMVIPDSVTSIGEETFQWCASLTSVTMGNGVNDIGQNAFSGCSGLTSITLPDSITSIGESAFSSCTSLTRSESACPSALKSLCLTLVWTNFMPWRSMTQTTNLPGVEVDSAIVFGGGGVIFHGVSCWDVRRDAGYSSVVNVGSTVTRPRSATDATKKTKGLGWNYQIGSAHARKVSPFQSSAGGPAWLASTMGTVPGRCTPCRSLSASSQPNRGRPNGGAVRSS